MILDPQTGAGAYKIAGGGNGGEVIFQGGAALFALKSTELTKRLAIIIVLVKLGALAFALSPFLYFLVFIALLLYIASIVISELGFNPKKNRQDWRNAWV